MVELVDTPDLGSGAVRYVGSSPILGIISIMDDIFTSGIIPLTEQDGEWKVFIVQHRGFEKFWSCPKGHVEAGETLEEAACRELEEETGLTVKRFLQDAPLLEEFHWVKNNEKRLKRVLYFLAEVEGEVHLDDQELAGGKWFSISEAIAIIEHPEGKTTLRRVLSFLNSLL